MSEAAPAPVGLVVSDVDGTLVTPDKRLTPAAIAAAAALRQAGVRLSLISSRPPRGMAGVRQALGLDQPFAAFDGGLICDPGGAALDNFPLDPATAREALAALADARIDAWVFIGDTWFISDPAGPKIDRETLTIGYGPTQALDLAALQGPVGKIVGVSDDHDALARLGEALGRQLGARAAVRLSQPYYLDITDPAAAKGPGVARLCQRIGVAAERTIVLGDMWNDVSMFEVAGFSIAMGQAPDGVKAKAGAVAASNAEDGWAKAIHEIVLPRLARLAP